jgi:hypothetical protein
VCQLAICQLTANWQQPAGEKGLLGLGMSTSKEYDYFHLGLNANYAHDFNNRNTTLSAGIAMARDSIESVGGAPTPLSAMLDVGDVRCVAGHFPRPGDAGELLVQLFRRLPE